MNYKRKHESYDWTPLEGISKHPMTGRGFSAFTRAEGDRIRSFYFSSGAPMRLIGEHLEVTADIIRRCVSREIKHVRRNQTGAAKARYWREKRARQCMTAWKREAEA